ncbi:hypothetical protein K458DRAFT_294350 [Lentithecium fluviatile CBS 122367]|uniref:Uncharacterized protein n=1 Tax=Lentithecium fluviatile CBS 122367 TaxID=1168545 RepID=A0A6G1JCR3_9PLEO|nr:hypothetical protein K458DRAFT_294350 [Lentithecium fluviatile CBS 122367]
MLPALQPSRPKAPQQLSQPTYTHIQTRAVHETPQPYTQPHTQPHVQRLPATLSMSLSQQQNTFKPRSQIEAMHPFAASSPFSPPRAFYDSAIRHPVFFTETLRKPPFPIPAVASQGWSPVASGYIMEERRSARKDGVARGKL